MEKGNGWKRWIWVTGIVILVLVGIAGFLSKSAFQDLKAKDCRLEETDQKLVKSDSTITSEVNGLKTNYLILNAKMNLLLQERGFSSEKIKELENSYKYKKGGE